MRVEDWCSYLAHECTSGRADVTHGADRRLSGLLLREAVECAEAPDKFAAVYADHFAFGECALEDRGSPAVAGIGKRGQEHHFVGNVKIRVARR